MRRSIGIAALAAAVFIWSTAGRLSGNNGTSPADFYIVSQVTSDSSPFWYHYILQVTAQGSDSVVTYIRIAPLDSPCDRAVTVEAARIRLAGISPADLASGYNLCEVDSVSLNRKLQRRVRTAEVDDSVQLSIVETCGSREAILHLPFPEQVKLDRLRKLSTELARWWNLQDLIKERAFGTDKVFDHVSATRKEALQREGELVVPELRAGRFDGGLQSNCATGQTCRARSFREELRDYVGPLGSHGYEPALVQAGTYRLDRYVPPKYPPLAVETRISGTVKLDLTVDKGTGEVLEIRLLHGHPLFTDAVKDAVKQWVFAPHSLPDVQHVPVDLVFDWHCPVPSQN